MDAYILKDLRELLRSLFNSNNVSSLKLAGFQKMVRPSFILFASFVLTKYIFSCMYDPPRLYV
jgi:hypothetical protein